MKRRLTLIFVLACSLYIFFSCTGSGGGATFGGGQDTSSNGSSQTLKIENSFSLDEYKVAVKFSESVYKNYAENEVNYILSGSAIPAPSRASGGAAYPVSAMLLPDNKTVVLTMKSPLKKGSNFQIKAQGIRSSVSNLVINPADSIKNSMTVSTVFLSKDLFPPSIEVINLNSSGNRLVVRFNELVDPDSVSDVSRYTLLIDQAQAALLSETFTYETLFEGTLLKTRVSFGISGYQTVMEGTPVYLQISNISDLADSRNSGNAAVNASTDLTPPSVSSAGTVFISQTAVNISFTEIMDEQSVENTTNYFFNYGLNVLSAVLQSDGKTVRLTTSAMIPGRTYLGEVRNVTDSAMNLISDSGKSFSILYATNEPSNVNAVFLPQDNKTKITWEDDPLGITFTVYRNSARITKDNVTALEPIASGIASGVKQYLFNVPASTEGYYYYAVTSTHRDLTSDRDFSGSNSMESPAWEDNVRPLPPSSVSAAYSFVSIQTVISWTDASIDGGESYKILRHSSPITPASYSQASVIASGISRGVRTYQYTVPSNTSATIYYAVVSYDNSGNQDTSFTGNTASVWEDNTSTVTPLALFTVLPLSSGSTEVYFRTPADSIAPFVTICRATGGFPSKISDGSVVYSAEVVSATDYSFTDTGISGNTYFYSAFRHDSYGRSAYLTSSCKVSQVVPTIVQPCSFTGSASLRGSQAQTGTKIRAFDAAGTFCGLYQMTSQGTFYIVVYGDDSSAGDGGADENETVRFYVNGYMAQTQGDAVWNSGGTKVLNLTAGQ